MFQINIFGVQKHRNLCADYDNRRTFYNNFPMRFIISILCSIRECAYRFSVIVEFLWPRISARVLMSIPHSIARVANVCRKAWNPRFFSFNRFCNNSKLRWYDLTAIGFPFSETTYCESVFFFNCFNNEINCFGNGILRIE